MLARKQKGRNCRDQQHPKPLTTLARKQRSQNRRDQQHSKALSTLAVAVQHILVRYAHSNRGYTATLLPPRARFALSIL